MAADTFLIVSRGCPRELVRSLSKGGGKVRLCVPDAAEKELDSRPVMAILIDGEPKHRQDLRLIGKLKILRPAVPIIYLAEGGSEGTAVEAFRKGARDYYRKPVNLYDLRRNVLRLVALQRSSRGERRPYLWAPSATAEPLSGVGGNIPASLLRAIAYMEDNFDVEIPLDELAERAGVSRFHFCRIFKDAVGESPIRYLIRYRIERAKILLLTTDLPVGEISGLVGFGDLSNFSRTFRRFCSVSPSQYRAGRAVS